MGFASDFLNMLRAQARKELREAEQRSIEQPHFGVRWRSTGSVLAPLSVAVKYVDEREFGSAKSTADTQLEKREPTRPPATPPEKSVWPLPTEELAHNTLRIVDPDEVEDAVRIRLLGAGDHEVRERIESTVGALRERGAYRPIAKVSSAWRAELEDLTVRFPNFEPVIDYLRGWCAIGELEQQVLPMAPLLINGPPGIGKSLFADALAGFLGTTCVRIGFETAQTNSAIVGGAAYWSNSQPGAIFEALVHGEHANPVVLIDEIDKATALQYDPVNALLALLEPTTARRFKDLSFPWIEIDASFVTWICASNDADVLPAPILSRLIRFDIDSPNDEQARATVRAIFLSLCDSLPAAADRIRLSPEAIDELAKMAPRKAKLAMQRALAFCVFNQKELIGAADVFEKTGARKNTIGFVSQLETSRARVP